MVRGVSAEPLLDRAPRGSASGPALACRCWRSTTRPSTSAALTLLEKELIKAGLSIDEAIPEVTAALRTGIEGLDSGKEEHLIALADYMESRFRRDALVGGFKWAGRLRAAAHV